MPDVHSLRLANQQIFNYFLLALLNLILSYLDNWSSLFSLITSFFTHLPFSQSCLQVHVNIVECFVVLVVAKQNIAL
jgi:hypothetical protein